MRGGAISVLIFVNRVQPNLFLNRTKSINHETYMLVQVNAKFCNALTNVIAVDCSRERFVFQLLLHGRDFHIIKAARWTNERARYKKAAQLVGCKERTRHLCVARNARVGRVPHNRADDSVRITAPAHYVCALEGMLVGRREHLVIEIMKKADDSPLVNISIRSTIAPSARPHCGLYSKSVFTQAIALRVLAKQFPSFFSIRQCR